MKKNILSSFLIVAVALSSLLAFYSISRAIKVPESSTWIVPMVWVSFFAISLCLAGIFVKNRYAAEIAIFLSLFFSLLFSFSPVHFLIVIACGFLVLRGLMTIRNDLDMNVKVNLWKSLYVGKFKIILGLAILISSQYFFIIKSIDGPVVVPKFSAISERLIVPMLGFVNPQFSAADDEDLTVDEFIIRSQNEMLESSLDERDEQLIESNIPANIPAPQRESLKKQALEKVLEAKSRLVKQNQTLILEEGRNQFSKIAGRKVEGDEKISDVFAGMINDRINSHFQPNVGSTEKSSLFPFILTSILFITIWPLGSLLSTLWFAIVILIFKIFVKYGFVEIKKMMVEREIIG